MALEDIVDITISRTSLTISTASFSTIMIVGAHSAFTERAKKYGGIDEVANDFASDSAFYEAASAAFNNGASEVIIGRRDDSGVVAQVHTNTVTTATDDTVYSVKFNNAPDIEVKSGTGATPDSVADLLVEAVNASGAPFTAAANGAVAGEYSLTCDWPGLSFDVAVDSNQTTTESTAAVAPTESMTDALNAIETYIGTTEWQWYGLATIERTDADVADVAAWVESRFGLYGFRDDDKTDAENAASSSDLASSLGASSYQRTFAEYNKRPWLFPEISIMADRLGVDPDESATTWALVPNVVGPKPDSLGSVEDTLKAKNYNVFQVQGGQKIHQWGKTVGGEWIDVIVGIDWFTARTQERIFGVKVTASGNGSKVSYSNDGVGTIESQVRKQISDGINTDFFVEEPGREPSIDAPNVRDLSSTQRDSRVLPGLKFTAYIAGAIHATELNGTVLV